MTRFIWDKFSKDFLETLLSPYGTVVVSKEVTSEIKEIDVYFSPNISEIPSQLGLLGRLCQNPCLRLNYNPIGEKGFIFSRKVSVQLLSSFINYPQSQRHYG